MAVDPNRKKVQISYTSDDGDVYSIGTTQNHADAASATGGSGLPPYPRHWKVRKVHGISSDGLQKASLVMTSPADTLFVDAGGTFTIAGLGTFDVTGQTGERRSRLAPDPS